MERRKRWLFGQLFFSKNSGRYETRLVLIPPCLRIVYFPTAPFRAVMVFYLDTVTGNDTFPIHTYALFSVPGIVLN